MPRPGLPLCWLLGGYLAGLLAGRWLPIGPDPRWPALLAVLVVVSLGGIVWWWVDEVFEPGARQPSRLAGLVPLLAATAAFGLGAIALSAELRPRLPANHVARLVEAVGGRLRATLDARVVGVERTMGSGGAILVEAEALETPDGWSTAVGRVLVRVERGLIAPPVPGDRLRFTASLRFPRTFRNPGGYDGRTRLALRAIRVVGAVDDYAAVTRLSRGGFSARALLERLRDRVRGALEGAVRGPAAELLRALVLGEAGDLPREVRDAFQATGTAHILTISGLHTGLVAAAAFGLVRRIAGRVAPWLWPAADVRRGAALAALGPVFLYVGLAGGGVAAVRAALMAGAVLVALALGRRIGLWGAMSLAALLILAVQPAALFQLGFLLSFGAVCAILRLGPWLSALPGVRDLLAAPPPEAGPLARAARRAGAWLAGSVVVSAAAGLGTGPLIAATFGRVTLWAPVANLVAVPIAGGVAVALGLIGAGVALVEPAAAAPLFRADAAILDLAIRLVETMAGWPGAVVWVPAPAPWEVVLAYAALWLLPAAWPAARSPAARPPAAASPAAPSPRQLAARAAVLAAAALVVVAGVARARPAPPGTLRMTFLDVGAGDTALFELPGGERLLVDAGTAYEGSFDIGERVVAPFLLARGVTRIDTLLLRSPRPDRQGGLAFLARLFPIGEVWLPPGAPQVGGELGRVLADRRVPILVKRASDPPERLGPVTLTILPGGAVLAFRLAFGDVAVVYPPDGAEAPPPAAWPGPIAAGRAVLHWPDSPLPPYGVGPLLLTVRPDLVVVPAEPGRRALRDLPELLDLMEVHGARVLLPERDGAVVVTTDGRRLEVRTVGPAGPIEEGI